MCYILSRNRTEKRSTVKAENANANYTDDFHEGRGGKPTLRRDRWLAE